jgi:hypothetical protein
MASEEDDLVAGLIRSFQEQKARADAELTRLLERPDLYEVALRVMDAAYGNLCYLCHFNTLSNEAKTFPIQIVLTKMQVLLDEKFKKITGRSYIPEVVRQMRSAEEQRAREFLREAGGGGKVEPEVVEGEY